MRKRNLSHVFSLLSKNAHEVIKALIVKLCINAVTSFVILLTKINMILSRTDLKMI